MQALWRQLDSWRTIVLLGSASIMVLAFTMTPTTEVVSLFGFEVPTLCVWRLTTGISCPGCGMTRSFTFLAHGQVVEAFRMNALGPLLFVVVASQVPWQIYRIVGELRARLAEQPAA